MTRFQHIRGFSQLFENDLERLICIPQIKDFSPKERQVMFFAKVDFWGVTHLQECLKGGHG